MLMISDSIFCDACDSDWIVALLIISDMRFVFLATLVILDRFVGDVCGSDRIFCDVGDIGYDLFLEFYSFRIGCLAMLVIPIVFFVMLPISGMCFLYIGCFV